MFIILLTFKRVEMPSTVPALEPSTEEHTHLWAKGEDLADLISLVSAVPPRDLPHSSVVHIYWAPGVCRVLGEVRGPRKWAKWQPACPGRWGPGGTRTEKANHFRWWPQDPDQNLYPGSFKTASPDTHTRIGPWLLVFIGSSWLNPRMPRWLQKADFVTSLFLHIF